SHRGRVDGRLRRRRSPVYSAGHVEPGGPAAPAEPWRSGRGAERRCVRAHREPARVSRSPGTRRGGRRRRHGRGRVPPGADPGTGTGEGGHMNEAFVAILRRHLRYLPPEDELTPDAPLRALGLDSMAAVALMLDLEDAFARV